MKNSEKALLIFNIHKFVTYLYHAIIESFKINFLDLDLGTIDNFQTFCGLSPFRIQTRAFIT